MSRVTIAAGAVLCLLAAPALAADPKIRAAIKVLEATAADAAKVKAYCAMTKAMEAIGRNPDASGTLFVPYILGLALTEAMAIYALVIGLILIFAVG